jgi:hypothetical protein
MIYDRAMMVLVRGFLLKGVAIGEARLLVLSWWWLFIAATRNRSL